LLNTDLRLQTTFIERFQGIAATKPKQCLIEIVAALNLPKTALAEGLLEKARFL
jgi:hypothetical protein